MPEAVTPPNPADAADTARTVPDPTLLTIDALRREIAMLESLFAARLEAMENLTLERVKRIDEMADRSEEIRREQKTDTHAAVEAALASQKEATAKMESSTTTQITALRDNFETSINSVRTAIADLKDRMTAVESIKQGAGEQRTERRQTNAGLIAAVGIGITVLLALLAVLSFVAGAGT